MIWHVEGDILVVYALVVNGVAFKTYFLSLIGYEKLKLDLQPQTKTSVSSQALISYFLIYQYPPDK